MTEESKAKVVREEIVIKSKSGTPLMTFDNRISLERWFELRPPERRQLVNIFKRTVLEEPID